MTHKPVISTYRAKTSWPSVGTYPSCTLQPRSVDVCLLSCHAQGSCRGLAALLLSEDYPVKKDVTGSCPYFSILDTSPQRRVKGCISQLWYHSHELYFSMSHYKTSPMTSELWNIADFKRRKFPHKNNCFLAVGIWRTDPLKGWRKSCLGSAAPGSTAQETLRAGAEVWSPTVGFGHRGNETSAGEPVEWWFSLPHASAIHADFTNSKIIGLLVCCAPYLSPCLPDKASRLRTAGATASSVFSRLRCERRARQPGCCYVPARQGCCCPGH